MQCHVLDYPDDLKIFTKITSIEIKDLCVNIVIASLLDLVQDLQIRIARKCCSMLFCGLYWNTHLDNLASDLQILKIRIRGSTKIFKNLSFKTSNIYPSQGTEYDRLLTQYNFFSSYK